MANEQPSTTTHPQDGYDALAARFQIDPKQFRLALLAGAEAGEIQLPALDTSTEPALRGLGVLSRILQGQTPPLHPDGPLALSAVHKGLGRRAELRAISWEQAAARPTIENLPEAALDWAKLKEEQGQRLGLAPASISELRFLGSIVPVKRAYHEAALELLQWCEADLAVDENRTRDLLDGDIRPLREALERDPELSRRSARARDYLYGAAQQGAQTRAELLQKRKQWTAQAGTVAHEKGVDEGMRRMEDKIKAAMDPPETEPTADDRRAGRR